MEFKRILPHVYHLEFEECYDMAMHFLRYQGFYECLKFRGQIFTLVDYMEWYSKTLGKGAFTYPMDWAGFNIPSNVLIDVAHADVPDPTRYDIQMRGMVEVALQEEGDHKFYFIGTYTEDEGEAEGLDHEIAHALYFTDDDYREVMDDLLDELPRKNYDACWSALQEMGYHPAVCRDEIHAYAATGAVDEMKKPLTLHVRKPFIKAYKEQRKRFKF